MVLLESINVALGTPAYDFALTGIDEIGISGKNYSLKDFADRKILVIIFMCNHCPYVKAVWSRLVALQALFKDRGVQFVGINPNKNPDYTEETLEHMAEYFQRYQMNFPYLIDETQEVAKAYKAQCTPDIYVYNDERKLAYHGRIDDNWKELEKVTKQELAQALEALLHGEKPSANQNPSIGCSIKWRE